MTSRRIVIVTVVSAIVGSASWLFHTRSAAASNHSRVERGRYLVEAVTICFECHSERDYTKPGWPIPPGRKGSGRVLWGALVAPNISPDKTTGIGSWTDAEVLRAIKDGIGRDGRTLNPEMPSRYFSRLTGEDFLAIVTYVRSIPAVHHELPKCAPYVPGPNAPTVAMDSISLRQAAEQVRKGEALVRLAGCETCHTPANDKGYIHGMDFAGGPIFQHDNEVAASANLTPEASGLGYYSQDKFNRVMRTGRVGARTLNSAMPWWFYRNMTDEDLGAVFAYLKAIPPVRHRVDNTEPATACRLCGNRHGLGDRN